MSPEPTSVTKRNVPGDGFGEEQPVFSWSDPAIRLHGFGESLTFDPGVGEERFARASRWVEEVFERIRVVDDVGVVGCGPLVFASFTFDPETPGSFLVIPDRVIGRDASHSWITVNDFEDVATVVKSSMSNGSTKSRSVIPQHEWSETVGLALRAIEKGEVEKVVLASRRTLQLTSPLQRQRLLTRLAERFPMCMTFAMRDLIGASPELLVRRRADRFLSRPLAGTTARSADPSADDALGDALLHSDKDRREHAFALTSVLASLAPLSLDLDYDHSPSLLKLPNVQHLASRVEGTLNDNLTALDLVAALHPTAAVCGVPPKPALRVIQRLEDFDRGYYTGPVGWMDRNGDGDFAVALRCALIRDHEIELFAGAGIVAGSEAVSEGAEIDLKFDAMLSVLGE